MPSWSIVDAKIASRTFRETSHHQAATVVDTMTTHRIVVARAQAVDVTRTTTMTTDTPTMLQQLLQEQQATLQADAESVTDVAMTETTIQNTTNHHLAASARSQALVTCSKVLVLADWSAASSAAVKIREIALAQDLEEDAQPDLVLGSAAAVVAMIPTSLVAHVAAARRPTANGRKLHKPHL